MKLVLEIDTNTKEATLYKEGKVYYRLQHSDLKVNSEISEYMHSTTNTRLKNIVTVTLTGMEFLDAL